MQNIVRIYVLSKKSKRPEIGDIIEIYKNGKVRVSTNKVFTKLLLGMRVTKKELKKKQRELLGVCCGYNRNRTKIKVISE